MDTTVGTAKSVRTNIPARMDRLPWSRWLMMHGRFDEANQIVDMIEGEVMKEDHITSLPEPQGSMLVRPTGTVSFLRIVRTMLKEYPTRSLLGFSLMVG